MVSTARRYIRRNRSSTQNYEPEPDPEPELTPKEREKQAYKELKEAQERFQKVAWANRNKLSGKQELVRSGKALLEGSGKAVDAFFDANKSISESVERDIRRHSLEGKIDNTIINWLQSEKKGGSKKKSTRPEEYIEYTDPKTGRKVLINKRYLPKSSSTRRRR